jgi:hypothetical protein
MDSEIVSAFPGIFAEFRRQQFKLLWRGSRDGFGASEFHCRCDGHANTLTVILDTEGNIFGGFAPVKWESRKWNRKNGKENNRVKADDSQKSFIFTLKNEHKVGERRFGLKSEEKWRAILCAIECGPCFGCYSCDILISDNCNANTGSHSYGFGETYANDTEFDGARFSRVREISKSKKLKFSRSQTKQLLHRNSA